MLKLTHTQLDANRRLAVPSSDWSRKQSTVFAPYIQPSHAVLAYSCGDGSLLEALVGTSEAVSSKAGIELNQTLAATAAQKGIDVRPAASAFVGEVFDRILLGSGIDSLRDPVTDLEELFPLLADEGLLLLSEPMDAVGRIPQPLQQREFLTRLSGILNQAGYTVDDIAIKRHTYRSAGFQFRADDNTSPDARKTYWMVKPFLSLVAVARKTTLP